MDVPPLFPCPEVAVPPAEVLPVPRPPPPEPPFWPASTELLAPPPPPPSDVMVENTELLPMTLVEELDVAGPPEPTVTLWLPTAGQARPVAVR